MDLTTSEVIPRIPAAQPHGRVLDNRYELFDDLGGSDRARVFRAWDHQVQHIVAIKVLDERIARDGESVQSFERAMAYAASLPPHANIAAVLAVDQDHGLPFSVSQFVAGRNLKDLIAADGPLTVDRAFRIGRQAAQGLAFAHQYGLVHADVKPQNVLVGRQNQVKVTDFGMARAEDLADPRHAAMAMVRAQYLSPEQALGRAPDLASDIYSLGVVLYEMVTGRLPFTADSPVALAKKHVLEQPPDPHFVNPMVPSAAAAIILKALSKEPAARHRSAAALASALHEYLLLDKGDTPRYFPVPPPDRAQPLSAPRPPSEAASAGTTEAAGAIGTKPAAAAKSRHRTAALPKARPVERPRVAKPRTRRLRLGSLIFLAVVAVAGAGGWYAYKAIDRAINGPGSSGGSHPAHVKHQPARSAPIRTRAAPVARRPVTAPGCPAIGPVRLVDIYASNIAPVAGNPVTFNYTLVNDAPQCHSVALGLAFYRLGQPGAPLTTPPGSSITAAQPGSHVYQRQFTFSTSAVGQRFDVEWRVTDPSGARTYDTKRIAGLITVSAR